MNLMVNALMIVATILGSGMALPQARRLARTRRADGVSTMWVGVSLALNAWWIGYGLAAPVWALLPVSTDLVRAVFVHGVRVRHLDRPIQPARARARRARTGDGAAAVPGRRWLATRRGRRRALLRTAVVAGGRGRDEEPGNSSVCPRPRGSSPGSSRSSGWSTDTAVNDVALVAAGLLGVAMASVILVRLGVTGHQPLAMFTRCDLRAVEEGATVTIVMGAT